MNELAVVAENQLEPQLKGDIDQAITELVELHQNNRGEINRLAFETVTALSAADARSEELASQGTLSRWWGSLTGKNSSLRNQISRNHTAALYAMQSTVQKLAEQNLLSFELTAAVNNRLNCVQQNLSQDINEVHQDLNKTCKIMLNFFRQTQSNLLSVEDRLDKVEQGLNILDWMAGIEYKAFQGVPYAELSDVGKLVCVITDFYEASHGHWQNKDLPKIKKALDDVGLSPKAMTTYRKFFQQLAAEPEYQKLIADTAHLVMAEPVDMALLSVVKKREDYCGAERYQVQSLQKLMQDKGLETTEQEVADLLIENYVTDVTMVPWDSEITNTNLALELLFNIHQSRMQPELCAVSQIEEDREEQLESADTMTISVCQQVYAYDEERLLDAYRAGDGCAAYQLAVFDCRPEKSKEYLEQGVKAEDILCCSIYRRRYQADFVFAEDRYQQLVEMAERANVLAEYELYCWSVAEDKPSFVGVAAEDALDGLKHSAQCGLPAALFELANIYIREEAAELAVAQHKKAAEMGYLPSQAQLAKFYYQGIGVAKDYEKAWKWVQQPADKGRIPEAEYFAAAVLISRPHIGFEDEQKALEYLKKDYEDGYVEAGKAIGDWYAMHLGGEREKEQDDALALQWYEKAAERGSVYALIALGDYCSRINDMVEKIRKTLRASTGVKCAHEAYSMENAGLYYEKAAASGEAVALKNYIDSVYFCGKIFAGKKSGEKGISFRQVYQAYQQVAELGLRGAQNWLADLYECAMEKYYTPYRNKERKVDYRDGWERCGIWTSIIGRCPSMCEEKLSVDYDKGLLWRNKAAQSCYVGQYAIIPYREQAEWVCCEGVGADQVNRQRSLEGNPQAVMSLFITKSDIDFSYDDSFSHSVVQKKLK